MLYILKLNENNIKYTGPNGIKIKYRYLRDTPLTSCIPKLREPDTKPESPVPLLHPANNVLGKTLKYATIAPSPKAYEDPKKKQGMNERQKQVRELFFSGKISKARYDELLDADNTIYKDLLISTDLSNYSTFTDSYNSDGSTSLIEVTDKLKKKELNILNNLTKTC